MRRLCAISLPIVLLAFVCLGSMVLGCQNSEREALLKLKHSLSDPKNRLSSWKGDECCHDWLGVACDNVTGHVRTLDLRNYVTLYFNPSEANMLSAEKLDPSLGELRQLRHLDLSGNNFSSSTIPEFIGSMKHLRYLNLSLAWFSGAVPPSLGNLTRLRTLVLGPNGVLEYDVLTVDDLHWVSGLLKLHSLDMTYSNLNYAQESLQALGGLPSLSDLRLQGCFFGNPSQYLSNAFDNSTWLSSLDHLDLSYNTFQGPLPRFFANMTSLRFLDLSQNRFNGSIPLWFRNMRALEFINLDANDFSHVEGGAIMGIMGNPCKLKSLHLSWNPNLQGEIVSPHDNMSRCFTYDFETLDLSWNNMTGTLPYWLGKLTDLKYLNLSGNMFQGTIPSSLGSLSSLKTLKLSRLPLARVVLSDMLLANLSSLETLDLSHTHVELNITPDFLPPFQLSELLLKSCKIQGQIPLWIGTQKQLLSLDLSNNLLREQIAESLGNYNKLEQLDLSSNHLSGQIPELLGQCNNLEYLDLSYNSLSFNFSSDWRAPFQLRYLAMRSCGIQGELPQWIQTQNQLLLLDLSNNMISGKMPDWSPFGNLQYIYLSHNHIAGPITHFPAGIMSIDLSHNMLSGPLSQGLSTSHVEVGIPLCKLRSLEFVNVQNNTLSGTIPHDCWAGSDSLTAINLSFNKLSGLIPMSIGQLSSLAFLNLNNNSLEGEIPSTFNTLGSLQILDMGENKLLGKIPSFGVESHPYLQILRLRENQLGGGIPPKLCSLTHLRILDLAVNNLTGSIPRCFGHFMYMSSLAPALPPNFVYVVTTTSDVSADGGSSGLAYPNEEDIVEVLKGEELHYSSTLRFVENLDLSCNGLVGSIPEELTNLTGLIGLNLSYNHLIGRIPVKIGEMTSLESLDLSNNNLSGTIPATMSGLRFLSRLNLSHNKLHGDIPTGHQLQTLDDPSIYANNLGLCGDPLPKKCTRDDHQGQHQGQGQEEEQEEEEEEEDPREEVLFYLVVAVGFGTGFWAVLGTLWLNKRCRFALFQLVENITDYIYVRVAVLINKMRK